MKYLFVIVLMLVACSNNGEYLDDACPLSYYVPGKGTQNQVYCNLTGDLDVTGGVGTDILILESFGESISYLTATGETRWRTFIAAGVHGNFADLTENKVSVSFGEKYITLDLGTGEILSREIRNRKYRYLSNGTQGTMWSIGPSTFEDFEPEDIVEYSRGMDQLGNTYAIADTFGHRVIVYKNGLRREFWEFFPGHVQVLDDDHVMVVGEHSNRVYIQEISTGIKEFLKTCSIYPFTDTELTMEKVLAYEQSTDVPDCQGDLFSPNGAFITDTGNVIIADTDNHRVLEYGPNMDLIRTITNLNAPTKILEVK